MNVLIVGAGAVGALFGSALARQGARVSVVCRSDYDAVRRDGYDIRSPLLGDHRFRPEHVYRDVADCREPPDYLILTSKVLENVDRAALIRPAVGPRTVIVLIQNGVDIEPQIAAAFPDNELLSSLAFVAVGRSAAGPGQPSVARLADPRPLSATASRRRPQQTRGAVRGQQGAAAS